MTHMRCWVVHTEVDHLISVSGFNSNCIVTSDDVAGCVKKLKSGKNDGAGGSLLIIF